MQRYDFQSIPEIYLFKLAHENLNVSNTTDVQYHEEYFSSSPMFAFPLGGMCSACDIGPKFGTPKFGTFLMAKVPNFKSQFWDLYCKHCTCRQQQRHKWRRLVLVAVAAYTTQVLTSCLLLVPADQSCAIVEPWVVVEWLCSSSVPLGTRRRSQRRQFRPPLVHR